MINVSVGAVDRASGTVTGTLSRPGLTSLPVLRFAAALFIVLFHFSDHAPIPLKAFNPIFERGWIATDFFIILSGFVLSRAYCEKLLIHPVSFRSFMLKRVSRLWPLHALVMFALTLLMGAAFLLDVKGVEKLNLETWLSQFFLLNSVVATDHSWNGPSWTLSALIICYALFYGYARLIVRRKPWKLLIIALVILLVAQGLALGLTQRSLFDLAFDWALMRVIPLFFFGSLIERASKGMNLRPVSYFIIAGFAVAELIWLAGLPRSLLNDNAILLLLVMITVMSGNVSLTGSALTGRLGRGSFTLYLSHTLIKGIWFTLIGAEMMRFGPDSYVSWALFWLGIVMAVGAALVLEKWVDRPLTAWVDRYMRRFKT